MTEKEKKKKDIDEIEIIKEIFQNEHMLDIVLSVILVKIFPKRKITFTVYKVKNTVYDEFKNDVSDTMRIAGIVCDAALDYCGVKSKKIDVVGIKEDVEKDKKEVMLVIGQKYYINKFIDLFGSTDIYGDDKTIRYLGKIFGYPKCCINAFVKDARKAREKGEHPMLYAYNRYVKQCEEAMLPVAYCKRHKIKEPVLPNMIIDVNNEEIFLHDTDKAVQHIPCNPFCRETWFDYAYFHSWKRRILHVMENMLE